jgi:RecJ-like exonuclease
VKPIRRKIKMADISMCNGHGCPLERDECHRFTAPQSEHWQSWFTKAPHEDGNCEYYWDNAGHMKDIRHENPNPIESEK